MNLFKDFYAPLIPSEKRLFLIDFFRFSAIVLMVIFHTGYDLAMFGYWQFNMQGFFGFTLPRIIVTLFLLSSGLSLNLKPGKLSLKAEFINAWPRFLKLFIFALIISGVSRFMFPKNWIYFGTLHCLAALTIIAIFFRDRPKIALICGLLIQLNFFTDLIPLKDPLEILVSMKSVDFIPLYPWAGVFLLGMGLSPYIKHFNPKVPSFIAGPVSVISQKSLPIYLLHQPIIYSSILLFNTLTR